MRVAFYAPSDIEARNYHEVWQRVKPLARGLVNKGLNVAVFDTAATASEWNGKSEKISDIGDLDFCIGSHASVPDFLEAAGEFDLIHNFGHYIPVIYSECIDVPVLTTIPTLFSPSLLPIYRLFNERTHYVSTTDSGRIQGIDYDCTIYHGIELSEFPFQATPERYLVLVSDDLRAGEAEKALEIAARARMESIVIGSSAPKNPSSNVRYIGECDAQKKSAIISKACCLLAPSSDVVLLEANAFGTPVLVFAEGFASDLVSPGLNGFIVTGVGDAEHAMKQIDSISRENCRNFVEREFSCMRMVDRYLDAYASILEQQKRENLRPWGYYKVLSDLPDHKVKRIVIYPGKRLSLQRHTLRSEHWVIVSGQALVTLNSDTISLGPGQSVDIPTGAIHRIHNPLDQPLVFIEVQMGTYFGEDDIERLADDFQRI
ncbi:cupin domain-containing protein [Desulfomonile tiedjei]|uniref:Mannose-6-phosphate isomerase n=1 Tax=Desulfomonile tiedjei (strain ATCC 49306 / DSM 6799 / DCB-1) TaxID=706587 RepID=I4C744_DESTA|nr:cupin domain-containing protein [Desulfomonile tiedjei]AFM25385.1 mannose-6-phosphate isomerase [Desulfomonile tiedjei DSM 6799]